jgi:hypothetical protein
MFSPNEPFTRVDALSASPQQPTIRRVSRVRDGDPLHQGQPRLHAEERRRAWSRSYPQDQAPDGVRNSLLILRASSTSFLGSGRPERYRSMGAPFGSARRSCPARRRAFTLRPAAAPLPGKRSISSSANQGRGRGHLMEQVERRRGMRRPCRGRRVRIGERRQCSYGPAAVTTATEAAIAWDR